MKKKKFSWWPEELALLRQPEDLTVSEVANKYRILGRGSSKPGRWETDFVPYMRDIMDSFSQDCVEEIWFVKPSQTGATEALLNMILYSVISDPGNAMLIEPTENLADEISQERLDLLIQTTPQLKELKSSDLDDITRKKKVFQGMTVYLAWSNSPTSLASRPIRYCFFDEVDKYKKFSGDEASPLSLGKERTHTYTFNRKLVYVSTPTLDNGYIMRGEGTCDARFRYHVACPHCGHRQIFVFEQVQFGEFKDDIKKVEEASYYECEDCKGKIFNDAKGAMVRNGKWIDLNSGLEFDECIKQLRPKRIGFQINRLYSPWHTFGMVAREFLESKDYPEKLMNWRNSWMAEPWIDKLEVKTEQEVLANTIDIEPLYAPKDSVALTCGIDPSGDGFWFVVLAWKRDMSPHLVLYEFLDTWEEVRQLVHESHFPVAGSENQLPIWRAVIDTGGTALEGKDWSMTEAAYDWLRKNGRNKCCGSKGMSHPSSQRVIMVRLDKTPLGQPMPGGLMLLLLDTSAFKEAIHYRLAIKEGDPGRFTFHKETGGDFVSHLLAEERRRNSRGQVSWVKLRKANHWFDACVMAFAAADPEFQGGIRRVRGPRTAAEGEVESLPVNRTYRPNWMLDRY